MLQMIVTATAVISALGVVWEIGSRVRPHARPMARHPS